MRILAEKEPLASQLMQTMTPEGCAPLHFSPSSSAFIRTFVGVDPPSPPARRISQTELWDILAHSSNSTSAGALFKVDGGGANGGTGTRDLDELVLPTEDLIVEPRFQLVPTGDHGLVQSDGTIHVGRFLAAEVLLPAPSLETQPCSVLGPNDASLSAPTSSSSSSKISSYQSLIDLFRDPAATSAAPGLDDPSPSFTSSSHLPLSSTDTDLTAQDFLPPNEPTFALPNGSSSDLAWLFPREEGAVDHGKETQEGHQSWSRG